MRFIVEVKKDDFVTVVAEGVGIAPHGALLFTTKDQDLIVAYNVSEWVSVSSEDQ